MVFETHQWAYIEIRMVSKSIPRRVPIFVYQVYHHNLPRCLLPGKAPILAVLRSLWGQCLGSSGFVSMFCGFRVCTYIYIYIYLCVCVGVCVLAGYSFRAFRGSVL